MINRTTSSKFCSLLVAMAGLAITGQQASAGTWTKLTNLAPGNVVLMMLLPDGTVMAHNGYTGSGYGNAWYRLTPAANGSYATGTWTSRASSAYTRLWYSSQVLQDGRVFVAGGEYGTGTARAEVYNPVTNAWTTVNPPTTLLDPSQTSPVTGSAQCFYDSNSEILPNGNVLIMPVQPKVSAQPLIYNPNTNAWSAANKLFRGVYMDEATWVKLPDDTIVTIDPFGTNSERYNSATGSWINDSTVPVSLYDAFGSEMGGGLSLPNGKVFMIGATGNTALYTPSGTASPGSWAAGPVIPSARGTPDGPCAMLTTGNVLFAASAVPTSANHFPSPTYFYEYNWQTNSYTSVPAPNSTTAGSSDAISTFQALMLNLPDGTILYSHFGRDLYVYTPSGSPFTTYKPTVSSISLNGDGSYHLVGSNLNGFNEGASYGDDAQMNSNYPLVRVLHSNGNTYYCRSYNWSHTGVKTGITNTTEYKLPASLPAGSYSLQVVVNGIGSDLVTAPSITSDPGQVVICPGGSTSLSVAASGVGPFTYQWRRGTTNLTNAGDFSGVDTATLTINAAYADSGSDYNCVITNAAGSVTSANGTVEVCGTDFNCDGFVDFYDFTDFVACLEGNCAPGKTADFNGDGFPDIYDYSDFVTAFELGC